MQIYTLGTWPFRPSQSSMHVYGKMFKAARNLLGSARAWALQIRTREESKIAPGGAGVRRAARTQLACNRCSLGGRCGGARRARGAAKCARGVETQPKKSARPVSPAPGDTGTTQRLCLTWTWARKMKNENVSLAGSLALARCAKGSQSQRKHARARGRAGWRT